MYKLTESMYERVKATYGEDVAKDINDALRNPEGIKSEDTVCVTVSVNLDCRDKIVCLDSATFIFDKMDEVTDLKPPRMLDWYTPPRISSWATLKRRLSSSYTRVVTATTARWTALTMKMSPFILKTMNGIGCRI